MIAIEDEYPPKSPPLPTPTNDKSMTGCDLWSLHSFTYNTMNRVQFAR